MNYSFVTTVHNKILDQLLNTEWLDPLSLDKNFIEKHITQISFLEQLKNMIKHKDYSCHATLSLCKNILNALAKDDTPADWLYYIYQFTLHKAFPHAVDIPLIDKLNSACYLYLEMLRIVSKYEKNSNTDALHNKYPLTFLTEEEKDNLEDDTEYEVFLNVFHDNYVYEMMKLHGEVTGYNTIDHICGVHFLALFIGRQLKKHGLPVDLGRVSGSTAGHDIGKYGCTKSEQKRVPYLHYYYTDLWFSNHDIVYIRHIAANHSVWDLELENLSLESLILIYSDFRVKNHFNENNKPKMHIYSLSDSFNVILEKLDNLDTQKRKRYSRVYAKLKDFEDYMLHLGVHVDPENKIEPSENETQRLHYALMNGEEIIDHIKHLSINHNINLMYQLRDEYSLNKVLQLARSEENWTNFREYLRIFEEYSTYLTQRQKLITLNFLYEHLIHPQDDIRKHCAELIGSLIAMFDEVYRKEVPENFTIHTSEVTSVDLLDQYLHLFIFPDHTIIPKHRKWIGYSLSTMISSLFKHCKNTQSTNFEQMQNDYIDVLVKFYYKNMDKDHDIALYLIGTLKYIPIVADHSQFRILFDFLFALLKEKNYHLRISALKTALNLIPSICKDDDFRKKITSLLTNGIFYSPYPSENFIKLKIAKTLHLNQDIISKYAGYVAVDTQKIPALFLSNLKAGTSPAITNVHIEILLQEVIHNPQNNKLQTALHFCNLLKVNSSAKIKKNAGNALLKLIYHLSFEQRNEVAVELISALELEGYQFTEYIPNYLGELILMLKPLELDGLIDEFSEKIKKSSGELSSLLLKTIGIAIVNYPKYLTVFNEDHIHYKRRLTKMLGILLNGLVNYDMRIKQVAFTMIGKRIFGSRHLSLSEKNDIFKLIAKKMLTLLTDNKSEILSFLGNAAALHHTYRFISEYMFLKGGFHIEIPKKVAFFPGTFDPFSLSHKQITKSVRDLGFEVYLSIDEFSWSKKTLPHLLRKNIATMSIADELDIYLYPDSFPTNLAYKEDLKTLKENFPHSEVHIVVGSDVILNASSYQEKYDDSIHAFPHIIFDRDAFDKNTTTIDLAIQKIDGEVTILSLPPRYEDISCAQIRNYIDDNRDISSLVDPLTQNYIYTNGIYRREPQDKALMKGISFKIQMIKDFDSSLINELSSTFSENFETLHKTLVAFTNKHFARLLIIRDTNQNNRIIGFSAYHAMKLDTVFLDLKDASASDYIRKNSQGQIVMIDGIFIHPSFKRKNLGQILLTETLAFCLSKDYEYAVFNNIFADSVSLSLKRTLLYSGFKPLLFTDKKNPVFVVNMSAPCTLNLDVETILKEPFIHNPNVKKAILKSRNRLKKALTNLYPGHLVLTFDNDLLHDTLVRKICCENNVPATPQSPRILGDAMCVPFGIMLGRTILPNTVTKAMHTEKLFSPHMKKFSIGAFPHYTDLETQVKILRSFNRPIILVDDILHKGYRNNVIHPLLTKFNIPVQKTIVGILSAQGKEIMYKQNREIDSAYYIPRLRAWFKENFLYPFFGGDTVWRGKSPQRNLVPSVNLILPYTSPTFLKSASKEAQYNLSKTCIQNAMDILTVIEEEYHNIHQRNLTLASLGEIFTFPRCPDHGHNMYYDLNFSPSHYLENDLELLTRLKHTLLDK